MTASLARVLGLAACLAAARTFAADAAVTVLDVNGDGRADLAVANAGANTLSVLLNTTAPGAAASYAPASDFATGADPRAVAATDVDGDGRADLVATDGAGNSVAVLLNTTPPGADTASFADARQDIGKASPDTQPNPFTFIDVGNAPLNALQTSNAVTLAGLRGAAPVSVAGGEYSLGCTEAFTAADGTVADGEAVCVRHVSSGSPGTATHTTLSVGGVSDTYTSTTPSSEPLVAAGALGPQLLLALLLALGRKIRSRGCPRERIT